MDVISLSIYLIYFVSIFFAIFPNFLINQKIFFLVWLIIISCFSIITRTFLEFDFDSDLQGYINIIEKNKILICFNIDGCSDYAYWYYTREFIFWGSLKLFYFISNNINITFIILDIIISILIYASVSQLQLFLNKNFNVTDKQSFNYLRFLMIVLFPFLFGMQIALRQYFAMALGLLAFTYLLNFKRIQGTVFFFLSLLSHNGAIVLLPFLYLFKNSLVKIVFTFMSIVFVLYGIVNFSDNRFGIDLGDLKSFIMLSFIYITTSMIIFIIFFQRIRFEKYLKYILEFNAVLVIFMSILYFLIPGNQFDRVSYFIFPLMLYVICLVYETLLKNKIFIRIFIIMIMMFFLILYHPGIIL